MQSSIIDIALRVGELAGCRGYFRIDMRQKGNQLYVLYVNPNPDINTDSGSVRMAYKRGYLYREVIEKICSFAMGREL